jgi:hypothetical protein
MKQNGTLWNTPAKQVLEETGFETHETLANMKEVDGIGQLTIDEIGDEHIATSYDTPMRPDAFDLSDDSKWILSKAIFVKSCLHSASTLPTIA